MKQATGIVFLAVALAVKSSKHRCQPRVIHRCHLAWRRCKDGKNCSDAVCQSVKEQSRTRLAAGASRQVLFMTPPLNRDHQQPEEAECAFLGHV
ncbi:hypothetical protein GE09DRAFT_1078002 [Coniochaeta sp. 2T2.1]|nr:hypothetical protein GE09DRAFT_1078002 [Coniochaeta sp. 2T2.1]